MQWLNLTCSVILHTRHFIDTLRIKTCSLLISPNIYVFFIDTLRIYTCSLLIGSEYMHLKKKLICSLSIQLYLCEQDLDVMSRNTYMICINYEVKKLSIFLIIWTNIVPPLQCFLTHKFNVSEMNEFRHALAMFLSHRFMFLIWNERMW